MNRIDYDECRHCIYNIDGRRCERTGRRQTYCFIRYLIWELDQYMRALRR